MIPNATKKILNHYIKSDKEYRDYSKKFFTKIWSGQITSKAEKVLTRVELQKLRQMRAVVEKAHDAWFKAIGALR